MRGEQCDCACPCVAVVGSPPLARGTVLRDTKFPGMEGITPACAGNRFCYFFCGHVAEDHPRLRGEQDSAAAIMRTALGSPPLARGTDFFRGHITIDTGITPACAGNRLPHKVNTIQHEDHPRLRGEQFLATNWTCKKSGSPPLARGTVSDGHGISRGRRITPACAGNRMQQALYSDVD